MGSSQTVTARQYNEQLMCLNDKQFTCLNKFFLDLEVDWLFCCSTIPIANATQQIIDLEWEVLWYVAYSPNNYHLHTQSVVLLHTILIVLLAPPKSWRYQ